MAFAFFRKALGIKRNYEDKEFDEFLKTFDRNEGINASQFSKVFKKKAVRFLVLRNSGKHVIFDSSSPRDSPKPLPIFTSGKQSYNIIDMAFGSYALNNKIPLIYSVKVHDLSSIGQMMVTRAVHDIEEWRSTYMNSAHMGTWSKRIDCTRMAPQILRRNEFEKHGVAVCLLFNLDWSSSQNSGPGNLMEHSTKSFTVSPKRFYYTLFEHSAQLSVLVETLTNETFVTLSNALQNNRDVGTSLNSHCYDAISRAFNSFIESLKDVCLPKLYFPVWLSLNNALYFGPDSDAMFTDFTRSDCVASWLNIIPSPYSTGSFEGYSNTYDGLADCFVRNCMIPLISKSSNKEQRCFLTQLVTGILMHHLGWVASVVPHKSPTMDSTFNFAYASDESSSPCLVNQLLTQTGCIAMHLNTIAGKIFNCTVISGQARQYLLILLYFATYFLRFTCLSRSRECVPDLGNADLFELGHQKHRSRLSGKTRRKSGSAVTFTDAHDSGISSQEDLTTIVYSASTGSSPTHSSGMTLCMPRRLTRDQCRIAEAAAHQIVSREAAAAAAASGTARSTNYEALTLNEYGGPTSSTTGQSSWYSQYTEVSLLIEKYLDDEEEICSCIPPELFPGHCTPGVDSLSSSRGTPDSPPSSMKSASSPRNNRGEQFQINIPTRPADLFRPPIASRSLPESSGYGLEPNLSNPYPQPNSSVNHCLVGSTVFDRFHFGHVLQATTEHPDNFRPHLEDCLVRWLTYGPLVLRGANLSAKLPEGDNPTGKSQRSTNRQNKLPRWSASGLVVNADAKTVEALIMVQPNPNDVTVVRESHPPTNSRSQVSGSRSQLKSRTETNTRDTTVLLTPTQAISSAASRRSIPIKPAPLVSSMLDRCYLVYESTSCSALTLKHMEAHLQLIYLKSAVLADMLINEGCGVLQQANRMAAAAGCALGDLPLLISIIPAFCPQAASILNTNQFDWWTM